MQEPQREEDRIDALLLDAHPLLLGDAAKAEVEALGRRVALEDRVAVLVGDVLALVWREPRGGDVSRGLGFRQTKLESELPFAGLCRLGSLAVLGGGEHRREGEGPLLPHEQPVHLSRLLIDDRERRNLRRAVVQRTVTPRQIQKPTAPRGERAFKEALLALPRRIHGCFRV
ncbi:hypothetical protein Anae109_3681 [Anaeromyxobacter sp. Fw109-5]|nr:hypothetical protein [Anaeromyxobacter sp. Fw109-5]ABS27861.1 hypothetical protein Anae109_3681 [Anaeromyxobacter sp. Fw109-5]